MQNELGVDVPSAVAKKAQEVGCMQGVKYVYKDGEYGSKLPASSIGGKKSTRFGSIGSVIQLQFSLLLHRAGRNLPDLAASAVPMQTKFLWAMAGLHSGLLLTGV